MAGKIFVYLQGGLTPNLYTSKGGFCPLKNPLIPVVSFGYTLQSAKPTVSALCSYLLLALLQAVLTHKRKPVPSESESNGNTY